MGDIIVISILVLVVALIIRSIVRNHRQGGCAGCSCSCGKEKCEKYKKKP